MERCEAAETEQRATEEARIWRDGEIEGELVER